MISFNNPYSMKKVFLNIYNFFFDSEERIIKIIILFNLLNINISTYSFA